MRLFSISIMGLLKQFLIVSCLATLVACSTDPIRPTRTLGSLFGTKPVPQQPDPKNQPQQQATRPLVYQVKYYDKQVHHPENLHPDARNYGTIDKSGISLDPVQQNQLVYNPTYSVPPRYYYNPLIPEQPQVYYTVAQIGNSQVLIPCTDNLQQQESTIALNVDQQPQALQQQQPRPIVAQTQKQVRVIPPTTVQQPLVREQVVQAASDLQYHGSLPGSGVVGAGLNSVPYGYYYYYYIPDNTRGQQLQQPVQPVLPPQVVPQVPQINPYVNQQLLYRLNNNYNAYLQNPYTQNQYPYVPVIVGLNQQGLLPQVLPHNQVFQNQVLRVDGKDRQVMQGSQTKPVVNKETQ